MEVDQDTLRSIGSSGLVLAENQAILASMALQLPKAFDFCIAWRATAHIIMVILAQPRKNVTAENRDQSCQFNRRHLIQALFDPSWPLSKRITSLASETRNPAGTVAVAIEYEIALENCLGVIIQDLDNGANVHVNFLKQCWLADYVSVGLLEREDDLEELRPRRSDAVQNATCNFELE